MVLVQAAIRSALLPSAVAGLNTSSPALRTLSTSRPATQYTAWALFDGIPGPIDTPIVTGAFQLYNGAGLTDRNFRLSISAKSAPQFFAYCVAGHLISRVRLLFYGGNGFGNGPNLLMTFSGVCLSEFVCPDPCLLANVPLASFTANSRITTLQYLSASTPL